MTGVSTTATATACEREVRDLHVSPEGERRDREAVLAAVRDGYGARTGFDIEIRAVEPVATGDAPEGVVWIGLQETWLDEGDADDDRDG